MSFDFAANHGRRWRGLSQGACRDRGIYPWTGRATVGGGTIHGQPRTERVGLVWQLDVDALESIAIGAGMLGTGGGGNPHLGKLHARTLIADAGPITIVDPATVTDDALVVSVGRMGSPTVGFERIKQGDEELAAPRALERHLGRDATHLVPGEIGSSAMRPLAVAAQTGLPVIDGHGMGCSFPELQMDTFMILGVRPTPAPRADPRLEGSDVDQSRSPWIDFQNENLIARRDDGAVLAVVPDLICIVDGDNAEPITTEIVRYGLRVAVLGTPAPVQLRSDAALAVVGPAAFGYSDVPYQPLPGTFGRGVG